jgi:superfamily II DNA/RNA helicase
VRSRFLGSSFVVDSSRLISSHEQGDQLSEQSFRALGVRTEVADALAARDIHSPFRIQQLVVPAALGGSDILARSPTGSGKTLAFGLPLIEQLEPGGGPFALVLVPTRELAVQVVEELASPAAAARLRVAAVYGGVPVVPQWKRARGAEILVATPGRLQDLLLRRLVTLDGIRVLVLDEADRMLDMGFKPQVDAIVRRVPGQRQTMLFSATLDGEVGELARAYTRSPARFESGSADADEKPDVEHAFVAVSAGEKLDRLVDELEHDGGLTLVFVRTKRGAERLAAKLAARGVAAAALHGDMAQRSRERALERFRSGKVPTLIATDVAARGLDLDDITHVINFDPPDDDKSYVHRIGRTARAGRSGRGITFVLPEQQADVSRVASRLGHRESFERDGLRSAPARLVYSSRRGRRSKW